MSSSPRVPSRLLSSVFSFLLLLLAFPVLAQAAGEAGGETEAKPDFPPAADAFEALTADLEYRFIGPLGNRVAAVVGVPGEPGIYYVGAASGGIFKTTDGGVTWEPIFDDQPVASIGALAVAPSDANVVYAGTGETNIRSNISIGNGIYRSTDAGRTWKHLGLDRTGRIGRVLVHPNDPDTAWAAALGHAYGPQPERGVYKTTDGGETWRRVLFAGEEAGAIDLAMHPANPRILYAGTWQIEIRTWGRTSGGPASGLYKSTDGGETWDRLEGSDALGKGLPEGPWGKIGLAVTAAAPDRVYALIETNTNEDFAELEEHQGVLWRSDDAGRSWELVSSDHQIVQRPLYYTRAAAAPDDPDEIRFMSVSHTLSIDGGKTVTRVPSGGDHHDIWIDPKNGDRMILGHDQGISISTNRGKSWLRPQLPIAQMYHVATDDRVPYFVYGNRQDGPSFRGPSNTLSGGSIPLGAWHSVGGCESGFAIPEPGGRYVWSGCYDGILERYDVETGHARNVSVWPEAIESAPAEDLLYRVQWTFPVTISPHDPGVVYTGTQYVHRTTDAGQSWETISPDLTTDAPHLQVRSGGLTLDDASPTLAPVVFAIAESPLTPGEIWAGTNDGRVQVTRDGGESWTDVTSALPHLPEWGTVSNIEPSRHDAGTVYLTVDRHQEGDTLPYVYRTTDGGASWAKIVGGIPESTHSYAHCVREDPARPGLLFLGTENALYVSFDGGDGWLPLQGNLPPAPVHWIDIPEHFGDLVVATYGRGFWILDDLSPLRELSAEALGEPAHLFPPRPAYRFLSREAHVEQPGDPAAGENPPYGAFLHYHLAEEVEEGVSIEILGSRGSVLATLEDLPSGPGLHRAVWNLESDLTEPPKLRTRPLQHSHEAVPDDPGYRDLSEGFRYAVPVPPGTYSVRLKVGETSSIRPLTVLADPSSTSTPEDVRAQVNLVQNLRDASNRVVEQIDELEHMRHQLAGLTRRWEALDEDADEGAEAWTELIEAADELDEDLREVEGHLFDLRLTSAGQDFLRFPRGLYARLAYLAGSVAKGDFPPTDAQYQVFLNLLEDVEAAEARLEEVKAGPVAAFNALLAERGVEHVGVEPPEAAAAPAPAEGGGDEDETGGSEG